MRFTLHLLSFIPLFLCAQADLSEYEWEHFHLFQPVRDAVETSDAIWWAMDRYLVRYDRAKATTAVGIDPFHENQPLLYRKLWVDEQGRLHVYDRNGIAILSGQDWTNYTIPSIFGFNGIERILYLSEEGKYYILTSSSSISTWAPGQLPTPVFGLEAAIAEASWDATENRLWFTSGLELGYLQNGNFTLVDLPPNLGIIEYLETGDDGTLWVQFDDRILARKEGNWLSYNYPSELISESVKLSLNQLGQALLYSSGRSLLLQLETDSIAVVDWSTSLGQIPNEQSILLDHSGEAWWIKDQERGIGRYRGQGDVRWQQPSNWLPTSNQVASMTVDKDGRVWVTDGKDSYFYSDRQWWPAQRLFPGFPDTASQILFTDSSDPIVLASNERNPGIPPNPHLYWHQQNQWYEIPLPDFGLIGVPFSIERLQLDSHGNLWAVDVSGTGFAVWVDGRWEYIVRIDFFPTPPRFTDIAIDNESQQYIVSNDGYYIKSGLAYEYIPYERYGLPARNVSVTYRNVRLSPQQSLWMTVRGTVIKARKDGHGAQIPVLDAEGNSFTTDRIVNIIPFADDDVWLLYLNDGMAHFDGQYWTHIHLGNTPSLQWDKMRILEKDPLGRLWFAQPGGVSVLSPPELPVVFEAQRIESNQITVLPNPACCQVQLSWQQESQERVQIWLADAQGRQIKQLFDQIIGPGSQDLMIRRNGLPSGVYYAIRQSESQFDAATIVWK